MMTQKRTRVTFKEEEETHQCYLRWRNEGLASAASEMETSVEMSGCKYACVECAYGPVG